MKSLGNESLSLSHHMPRNLETTPTEQDRGIDLTTRLDGSGFLAVKTVKHCPVFRVFLRICKSARPSDSC